MHPLVSATPAENPPLPISGRTGSYVVVVLAAVMLMVVVVTRRPPAPLPQRWAVPAFSFVDHLGRPTSTETLRGAPYVASFFFTRCPTACPLLTSKLTRIQAQTRGRRLAFVSFSLDPDHDHADVLAAFARAWRPGETRWHLIPTTESTRREALAAFRVTVRATTEASSPIIHSSAFFLVDAEGFVRGVYPSDDDHKLEQITRDALALTNVERPTK